MFGARFYDQFGVAPTHSWIDAVAELDHQQIRGALTRIRNSGAAHPPGLPEFMALARNVLLPQGRREVYSAEALAAQERRLEALVEMRKTMPRDRHGHIVHPDFVPEAHRASFAAQWAAWEQQHPDIAASYARECALLLTGTA